jgi:hypothetical protein
MSKRDCDQISEKVHRVMSYASLEELEELGYTLDLLAEDVRHAFYDRSGEEEE